mgnify:CR=1 FL=1
MAPRRLVGPRSWHSHLRPQIGHPGCPLLCGPADTTIASPSIAAPPATVLAGARTYRRAFAMRPPPVAPDAFGEVESYGRGAPGLYQKTLTESRALLGFLCLSSFSLCVAAWRLLLNTLRQQSSRLFVTQVRNAI